MAFKLRKPPKLSAKYDAYPYQLDALRAVKPLTYAAIFHEQGLGKTKIAIDLILLWLTEDVVDTVFVITKKSLIKNWCDELVSHSYISPRILSGNRRENSIALNSPVLVYIMNYEVVSTNFKLINQFLKTCRVGAVLDESQKIKNPETLLSNSLHSISEHFERRIIMTGTPVANRPYDIWSQIKFLDGGEALGEFPEFKTTLNLPTSTTCVSEYGASLSSVMGKIKHFTVRETKASSGVELPEKTILIHSVKMEACQSKIYHAYRDEMQYKLDGGEIIDNAEEILKLLTRLLQCSSNPVLVDKSYQGQPGKFSRLLEILDEINIRSNKAIVWTGFIANVEWLSERLRQYFPQKVHGQMNIHDRNQSISRFKSEKRCRLLIATPGSAKEGLTLTVANHAIFFERGFSLDDYLQAQDRIHRISQFDDCFIHNLICTGTIDEWIDSLLNAKFQAAQLAQGDISENEFNCNFTFDLYETLGQILLNNH